jgi:hypothetical protein
LYVALLNVTPTGAVILMAPRGKRTIGAEGLIIPPGAKRIVPGDDCRAQDGEIIEAGAFLASRTPGIDQFKFIFSTGMLAYGDFAYLEQPPIGNLRGGASLGTEWTTVETNFEVIDTGQ